MNNDNIGVKPCPSCGRNLRSDATFCYMCGYNFVTKKGGNNIQPKIDIKEDLTNIHPEQAKEEDNKVNKIVTSGIKSLLLDRIIDKILRAILFLIATSLIFGGLAGDGTKFWIYVIGAIVVLISVLIFLVRRSLKYDNIISSNFKQLVQNGKSGYILILLLIIIAIIFLV